MNDRCQNFVSNRMSYSVRNHDNDNNLISEFSNDIVGPLAPVQEESESKSKNDSENENKSNSENERENEIESEQAQNDDAIDAINAIDTIDSSPQPQCREVRLVKNTFSNDYVNEHEGEEQHCSICLESFNVGDSVSWSKNLTHCR